MTSQEPSRLWPYLKAFASSIKIPGTDLTLGTLGDLQDHLADDEAQKQIREALDAILENQAAIVAELRALDAEIPEETISEERLSAAAAELAEAAYLRRVADKYLYSDFKGIEQLEKLVPLKLDDVFVDLRVRREGAGGERHEREAELIERLAAEEAAERGHAEERLTELDVARLRAGRSGKPEAIDKVLARPGGAVLLGGPGSGKTTLVKRLARSLALGPEVARKRYPDLPWCLPFVLPVSVFDVQADGRTILELVRDRLAEVGGRALVAAFEGRRSAGECLVLLDGLDEVADTGRRIGCARAAGELVREAGRNRVLVTSRPVGYSICRLSVPAEHVVLEAFGSGDVETFVRQWHLAYDRAVHPESPDPAAAKTLAEELNADIRSNPRVESLATNPLMLTIIALIKQQNVTLPERRVGLYEIALNTLIRSWNKARSLANRPVGEDLSAVETKKIWAAVAYWMHSERSTGTCHRQQLQAKLVDVLIDFEYRELEAETIAESYIEAAAERAGLLEERGADVFAFMHQTFQEYLAARHLWLSRPRAKAIERVLAVTGDPRWHEVVRLTAGFVGVIQEDDEMVTELVEAVLEQEDPLEPYLCGNLRLAASCVADDVRVASRVAGEVVVRICERLRALPYWPVVERLAANLEEMRSYCPNSQALRALRELRRDGRWQVRQEAARMLSRSAADDPLVVPALSELLKDGDENVRAHAALGLWRSRERDDGLLKPILRANSCARMPQAAVRGLAQRLVPLLESEDAEVQLSAAEVLGNWGPHAETVPALVKLLESEEAAVRLRAAEVLGNWGPQAEAVPALVKLLESEEAWVRFRAAEVLGNWGRDVDATVAVLAGLVTETRPLLQFFERKEPGRPGGETARLLAAIVEPHGDDSEPIRLRRRIVFDWLWQASQGTDHSVVPRKGGGEA